MNPLKNTDTYLSDWLPAALVKDWRQCFRSRSALLLFILLELAGWLLFVGMMGESGSSSELWARALDAMDGPLYCFGLFALGFAIPCRAGMTVAADTRVHSANFLMLTPLSARRIVWGTWSSTALMVFLAALGALPLLLTRQLMFCLEPGSCSLNLAAFNQEAMLRDILLLAWLVLCGWVSAACAMFAGGMSRLLQLALPALCVLTLFIQMTGGTYRLGLFFGVEEGGVLPHVPTTLLYLADAALLIGLFLELARRHYAPPAENCSRSVRLLALVPMLLFVLLQLGRMGGLELGIDGFVAAGQGEFALFFLYGALLADALLPTYTMPAQAGRFWRWLPAWVQKPGVVPSALCLALASIFYGLPELLTLPGVIPAARLLSEALNFGFSLLLWLLITDFFCRPSSRKRPLVFALVAPACNFVVLCLLMLLSGRPECKAVFPQAGSVYVHAGTELEAVALNAGALLVTLLLLCWRARRRQG